MAGALGKCFCDFFFEHYFVLANQSSGTCTRNGKVYPNFSQLTISNLTSP